MLTKPQADILELLQEFQCLRTHSVEKYLKAKFNSTEEHTERIFRQLRYLGKIMIKNGFISLNNHVPDLDIISAFDVCMDLAADNVKLITKGVKPLVLQFFAEDTENNVYGHFGIVKLLQGFEHHICQQLEAVNREMVIIFILCNMEQQELINTRNQSLSVMQNEDGSYKYYENS